MKGKERDDEKKNYLLLCVCVCSDSDIRPAVYLRVFACAPQEYNVCTMILLARRTHTAQTYA